MLFRLLLESGEINYEELEAFKGVIAGKIKQLPADDATAKTLREIEDLLKHVHAGGKLGIINGELQRVNDPTVTAAQKILAQYIYSIEMDPKEREELFTLWREDKLVDTKKLLSKGKYTFNEIIRSYDSNKGIKTFVDEIMKISALGQGKGEFGLSVLSKEINRPKTKGDLLINGRKIEVKTFDKAAARFTDQEVIPASGYAQAAEKLNAFVRARDPGLVPKSGLNMTSAIEFGAGLTGSDRTKYFGLVAPVIELIFGGPKANEDDVAAVVNAMRNNKPNEAKQAYARANFNYYMSLKDDEGVLSLDISKDPITSIFYQSADDLTAISQRFEAETNYITSPTFREIYPKIKIVDTTFGANARAQADAKAAAQAEKERKALARQPLNAPQPKRGVTNAQFQKDVLASVKTFANNRGITDKKVIAQMAGLTMQSIMSGNSDPKKLTAKLAKAFPELKAK